MSRRYFMLDVFTEHPLTGNQLAVVLDGDGLDDDGMQKIAAEFNVPETVFVLPAEAADHRAKIKIFTPARELPFAGHPTVGSAVLLATLDGLPDEGGTLVLEEGVGPVTCDIKGTNGKRSARFGLPKTPVRLDWDHDPALLAEALGIREDAIGFDAHEVAAWNGGIPYVLVPVNTLDAVASAKVDTAKLARIKRTFDGHLADVYIYAKGGVEGGTNFHARMFAPENGIPEDPATGSAVASFCGQLAAVDIPQDGKRNFAIEQGYEMGRPSKIFLDVEKSNNTITAAGISGHAVIIGEGKLLI